MKYSEVCGVGYVHSEIKMMKYFLVAEQGVWGKSAEENIWNNPASWPMHNGGSYPGVKWPGNEADHSPPSISEVKNAKSYTSSPQYVFML